MVAKADMPSGCFYVYCSGQSLATRPGDKGCLLTAGGSYYIPDHSCTDLWNPEKLHPVFYIFGIHRPACACGWIHGQVSPTSAVIKLEFAVAACWNIMQNVFFQNIPCKTGLQVRVKK
jgi:hypothetical protein